MNSSADSPKSFFKYLAPSGIVALTNRTLRFSRAKDFNDPFEMKPVFERALDTDILAREFRSQAPELAKQELERQMPGILSSSFATEVLKRLTSALNGGPELAETLNQRAGPLIEARLNQTINEHLGILCLTTNSENLLMWAHYGGQHQGIVLELDASHPWFHRRRSPRDELYCARAVQYSQQRPKMTLSSGNSVDLFLTKSAEWAYEEEHRFMAPLKDCRQDGEVWVMDYPPGMLKSVRLGCRIADGAKAAAIKSLALADMSHVGVIQMELSMAEFGLRHSVI